MTRYCVECERGFEAYGSDIMCVSCQVDKQERAERLSQLFNPPTLPDTQKLIEDHMEAHRLISEVFDT